MQLISYGNVAALERRHGGEREQLGPPGEGKPMHERWAQRFANGPVDDISDLLAEAQAELDAWIRRPLAPVTAESWDELAERIVSDGWALSAAECARSLRCTPSMVRRARLTARRHPENGYPLPEAEPDAWAYARTLDRVGLSVRQIGQLTGLPKSTLHDRLTA